MLISEHMLIRCTIMSFPVECRDRDRKEGKFTDTHLKLVVYWAREGSHSEIRGNHVTDTSKRRSPLSKKRSS